jgi:hypothetical protein
MLWGRQKRRVFVQIHAPEMPKPGATEATGAQIDGTVGHPGATGQGSLPLGDEDGGETGEGGTGDGDGLGGFDDDMARGTGDPDAGDPDDDGSAHPDADPQRGENWPFPTGAADGSSDMERSAKAMAEREQAELEAGMQKSLEKAGVSPKGARRPRKAAVGAVE